MKKLSINLDPALDWNTDRWERRFQGNSGRECLKIMIDAISVVFHNLLHDIPCDVPAGISGLEEILCGVDDCRRERIMWQIADCDRMVASVQLMQEGPYADITFYSRRKKKCNFSIEYDRGNRKFYCIF